MTGRNDMCSCGSGKKHKKCCGKAGKGLLNTVVNEELNRILVQFFDTYPVGDAREEMMHLMRQWADRLSGSWESAHIEEAAAEFFLFIKSNYQWKQYIREQREQAARGTIQTVLEKWEEPFILLGEITEENSEALSVTGLLTGEVVEVTKIEGMPTDKGTLLFGIVLPDARRGELAVAPVSSMLFLAKWSKQTKKSLLALHKNSKAASAKIFFRDYALDIYELLVKRSMATMNEMIEDVLAETQLDALREIDRLLVKKNEPADVREMLQKLAVAYFLNTELEASTTDNMESFKHALVEVGCSLTLLDREAYIEKVSDEPRARQLTVELKELYDAMMQGGDAAAASIYEIGIYPRPSEAKLWETAMTTAGVVKPEQRSGVNEGRAQRIAYEAYKAATEEERRKLAESSFAIAPKLPDALLLQAETVDNPVRARELYEQAIREASKRFVPGENPWNNLPNRPFMRAAFAYGVHLFMKKEYDEASDIFKDLVRMNATDNQGARYEAISSLIHAKRYQEAGELLVRYERGSENDATYLYLDWKLEKEASEKETDEGAAMLQKASEANGYVSHFMTFRAPTEDYPHYERLEPGSKEEARYIWLLLNGPK